MAQIVDTPFAVELVRHTGVEETPTGPATVEFDQYVVIVASDAIKEASHRLRNDSGRIQVGYIGTQQGANFCPIETFYEFTPHQQATIVAECKRLHGGASPAPHVDLPPPIEVMAEAEFEDIDE